MPMTHDRKNTVHQSDQDPIIFYNCLHGVLNGLIEAAKGIPQLVYIIEQVWTMKLAAKFY